MSLRNSTGSNPQAFLEMQGASRGSRGPRNRRGRGTEKLLDSKLRVNVTEQREGSLEGTWLGEGLVILGGREGRERGRRDSGTDRERRLAWPLSERLG